MYEYTNYCFIKYYYIFTKMINYILLLSFIMCAFNTFFDKGICQGQPFADGKLEMDYDGKKCVAQLAPIDMTHWEQVADVGYEGVVYPLYCPTGPLQKATFESPNEADKDKDEGEVKEADKGTIEGEGKEADTGSVEGEGKEADTGSVDGGGKEADTGSVEEENKTEASKDVPEDVTNTLNDNARKDEL